ncbi:MAG: tetratricopeptide repeat protein [Myxococcota bacterium]
MRWLPIALLSGLFGGWETSAHAADPSAEISRQLTTTRVRLAQLEALLVEAELRVEQVEEVIRTQGRDEQSRLENIDQVNAEVARLRGAIEVLEFTTNELKQSLTDFQLETERRQLHAEMRLAQIESYLKIEPPPVPTDADLGLSEGEGRPVTSAPSTGPERDELPGAPAPLDRGDEGEGTPSGLPQTPGEKLALAVGHMADGRQTVARAVLAEAINAHPGAEEMAEIRYRHAETFFNEGDYKGAIKEFNKVLNNHPKSDWRCWSMYRMGESFERLGKGPGSAKAFYKGATDRGCKNSEAAKLARQKL